MKTIFTNGTIEASLMPEIDKWVFLYWETNKLGHLPVSFLKGVKKSEALIKERKYPGWICNSEKEHKEMHEIIKKLGGKEYADDGELLWFRKKIN